LTDADLAELPGIGTATTDKFGDRPIGLPDLVMAARELRGSSTIPMQAGIAGPVLRGADRSVYLFRITAADKSRPPRDLEEVRERIVADLSKMTAYRELVAQAEEIRSQAVSEGMLATALAHGTTVGRNVSFSMNTAATASFPGLGPSKEAAEVIIDRAIALPADKPLAELPETALVVVVPVESALALLVTRLVDRTPVTARHGAGPASERRDRRRHRVPGRLQVCGPGPAARLQVRRGRRICRRRCHARSAGACAGGELKRVESRA
jgi:hypothetical protein